MFSAQSTFCLISAQNYRFVFVWMAVLPKPSCLSMGNPANWKGGYPWALAHCAFDTFAQRAQSNFFFSEYQYRASNTPLDTCILQLVEFEVIFTKYCCCNFIRFMIRVNNFLAFFNIFCNLPSMFLMALHNCKILACLLFARPIVSYASLAAHSFPCKIASPSIAV